MTDQHDEKAREWKETAHCMGGVRLCASCMASLAAFASASADEALERARGICRRVASEEAPRSQVGKHAALRCDELIGYAQRDARSSPSEPPPASCQHRDEDGHFYFGSCALCGVNTITKEAAPPAAETGKACDWTQCSEYGFSKCTFQHHHDGPHSYEPAPERRASAEEKGDALLAAITPDDAPAPDAALRARAEAAEARIAEMEKDERRNALSFDVYRTAALKLEDAQRKRIAELEAAERERDALRGLLRTARTHYVGWNRTLNGSTYNGEIRAIDAALKETPSQAQAADPRECIKARYVVPAQQLADANARIAELEKALRRLHDVFDWAAINVEAGNKDAAKELSESFAQARAALRAKEPAEHGASEEN